MSKYKVGYYPDGRPAHKYFRRGKHFKNKYRSIRWAMAVAQDYKDLRN